MALPDVSPLKTSPKAGQHHQTLPTAPLAWATRSSTKPPPPLSSPAASLGGAATCRAASARGRVPSVTCRGHPQPPGCTRVPRGTARGGDPQYGGLTAPAARAPLRAAVSPRRSPTFATRDARRSRPGQAGSGPRCRPGLRAPRPAPLPPDRRDTAGLLSAAAAMRGKSSRPPSPAFRAGG